MTINRIEAPKNNLIHKVFSFKVKSIPKVYKESQKFDGISGYIMATTGGLYGIYNRLK